jgi:hypothetical protein
MKNLFDPSWTDDYRWMTFNQRFALGMLTSALCVGGIVGIIIGCIYLSATGYGWYVFGGVVAFILFVLGRFFYGIYKQYRRHHPKPQRDILAEKKHSLNDL